MVMLPIKDPGSGSYTENINVIVTLRLFVYWFLQLRNISQLCLSAWTWRCALYLYLTDICYHSKGVFKARFNCL